MNNKKRFLIILLVALLAAALPIESFATVYAYPGDTVNCTLVFYNTSAITGDVTLDNPGLFSSVSVSYSADGGASGSCWGSGSSYHFEIYQNSGALSTFYITFTCVVSSGATPGSQCGFNFSGQMGAEGGMAGDYTTNYNNVVIQARPAPAVDTVDRTKLKEQIDIANTFSQPGYTDDSWDILQEALKNGNQQYKYGNQSQVDSATETLKNAIAGLKEMDYSRLEAAIKESNDYFDTIEEDDYFRDLFGKLSKGEELLKSGNQEKVDAAADAILESLKALQDKLDQIISEADKDPEGPYCNIHIHYVWPILFAISGVLNLILIILLAKKKKKKEEPDENEEIVGTEAEEIEEA